METVQKLIREVGRARHAFLDNLTGLTEDQADWKPAPATWSVIDITEHLFWAEQGSIVGMWQTLHAIRDGKLAACYTSIHQDLPIEKIVELTWQPREQVPAGAAPRQGGPLAFWQAALHGLQALLEAFGDDITEPELSLQAHPHPISGPVDFRQRLEFLRFHLHRHQGQVSRVREAMPLEMALA